MSDILASLDDINTYLPTDKIEATEGNEEIDLFQIDVDRLIRGYLATVYSPTTLAAWTDPGNTPGLIRSIAGRFIAAFYYAERAAEDQPDIPPYAQNLYNQALQMLTDIRSGLLVVDGIPPDDVVLRLPDPDFFWPNDTTDPPKFTMGARF